MKENITIPYVSKNKISLFLNNTIFQEKKSKKKTKQNRVL